MGAVGRQWELRESSVDLDSSAGTRQRSAEYRMRPDLKANLKRAELVRRRKATGYPAESVVIFS
jgi:hypothetical protein